MPLESIGSKLFARGSFDTACVECAMCEKPSHGTMLRCPRYLKGSRGAPAKKWRVRQWNCRGGLRYSTRRGTTPDPSSPVLHDTDDEFESWAFPMAPAGP